MKKEQATILGAALLLISASVMVANADVPRPQPVSRYAELWNNSRITSKPPPPEQEPDDAVFEDYALLSVTPMGSDYIVSIKNKKNAAEGRIRIFPGETNSKGFSVKSVNQSNDYMATKVTLLHEGKVGVVEYDEKYLALKKPPAAAKQKAPAKNQKPNTRNTKTTTNRTPPNPAAANANQNMPPGLQSALNGNNANTNNAQSTGTKTRKPRVRRVPTPPSR